MRFSHFLRTQIFDAILVQHASTFAPKIHQNRFENRSWKASIFESILASFFFILARFWKPTWRHVGNFFNQNGCTLWCLPLFLPGSMFLSEFLAVLTPLLRKMSRAAPRFWTVFGLDFGMFWAPFWKFLVTICPLFGVHFLHNLRINSISFLK